MALLGLVVVIVAVMMMTRKSGFGYVPVPVRFPIHNGTNRTLEVQIDALNKNGDIIKGGWSKKGFAIWGGDGTFTNDIPTNVPFFRISLWCQTWPYNKTYIYGLRETPNVNGTYKTRFLLHNGSTTGNDPFIQDGDATSLIIWPARKLNGRYQWEVGFPS
jgi:hypothetical protein